MYLTRDIPYTEDMLATEFNRPIDTVRLALKVLQSFDMIEIIDDIYQVTNWEKYQNADGLEKLREYNRIAKQKERKRKRELPPCNEQMSMTRQGQFNESQGTDIDKDKDIDIDIDKESREKKTDKPSHTRFIVPTVEEVQTYCTERENGIDAQRFIDYYTSKGWLVGKTKMKDWKAAVRTWEGRDSNGYVHEKANGYCTKDGKKQDSYGNPIL